MELCIKKQDARRVIDGNIGNTRNIMVIPISVLPRLVTSNSIKPLKYKIIKENLYIVFQTNLILIILSIQ